MLMQHVAGANNADCVNQPPAAGRASYWAMPHLSASRHVIVYEPDRMACLAETDGDTVLYTWQTAAKEQMPAPEGMLVHINLWLFRGQTFNMTQGVEVVVSDFEHTPWSG